MLFMQFLFLTEFLLPGSTSLLRTFQNCFLSAKRVLNLLKVMILSSKRATAHASRRHCCTVQNFLQLALNPLQYLSTLRVGENNVISKSYLRLRVFEIYRSYLNLGVVKSDSSVRYCTSAYTGQVTFYKVLEQHGHVQLVTLQINMNESSIEALKLHNKIY